MAARRWSLALVALVLGTTAAPAQGIYISGGSFGYGHWRSSRSLTISVGGPYGYGYFGSSYYPTFGGSRVTIILSGASVAVVPVITLPRPTEIPDDSAPRTPPQRAPERRRDLFPDNPPAAAPAPDRNPALPDPMEAEARERARRRADPDLPPPGPVPPQVPGGASLVERGRAAFAAGQIGRAADFFRRAAAADAADPVPSFLLIETLIALDKYSAAADTARSAVERFPEWTSLRIRPIDLYGGRASDYATDLKRLDELLAEYPDDAVLLFLCGHTLWFDGHKDEARALFRRAAPTIRAAERFLQTHPPAVL